MGILLENIRFAPGECFRLLRWQGKSHTLESREAGGRRIGVTGVGERWHSHAEMEFTIFLRGSGMRYVGDHVGAFGAMDCVLLGSHLPHCWMEAGRTDGWVLQFHLAPEHPLRRLGGAGELQRLFAAAERGLHFHPATAQRAVVVLEQMADASCLARTGLLLELLALLHDAPRKQTTKLSQARVFAEVNAATRPRLEAVVQWVLEQFTEPLKLDEAVQRSAMSRATFCRQFVRHTGKTFIAFVTDARLACAHQWVTQTHRSITDIAFASGFSSLTRFNTAFRAKFGHAPRALRNTR
ncbi:MAG: AraC family transcriptional regulator [Chthoniobacter sp.]|uniref:AraC family transcriptional regulator n=1 Tax=Chthoniobacter sp. TaxID=2510640 RepID=UPI0032A23C14